MTIVICQTFYKKNLIIILMLIIIDKINSKYSKFLFRVHLIKINLILSNEFLLTNNKLNS